MNTIRLIARVLTLRLTAEEFERLSWRHLLIGLGMVWLAGIGRSWDHAEASLLQHSGVGSLAYVFAFSAVIWLLVAPLGPRHWSYRRVLTYVSLTAPPALLYAIPVEWWLEAGAARQVNMTFLAVVAAWRVAMLIALLRRCVSLSLVKTAVAALTPLCLIVAALAVTGFHFDIAQAMGGFEPVPDPPPADEPGDTAMIVVQAIGYLAIGALPLVLAAYGWLTGQARGWWGSRSLAAPSRASAQTA